MSFFGGLKALDAYPKLHEGVGVKTFSGAVVSLFAIAAIVTLFVSELSLYLNIDTEDRLLVDVSRGEKIKIFFDVTFPKIPCSLVSVDAMDVSGEHQLDVNHHIQKKNLDPQGKVSGQVIQHEPSKHTLKSDQITTREDQKANHPTEDPNYCGSCYGSQSSEGQCCNTCEEVKAAYRKKGWGLLSLDEVEQCSAPADTQKLFNEMLRAGYGCQLFGYLEVNKVAGNFHFAPGKSFQHSHMHVHDLAAFSSGQFNVSHKINSLSFGAPFPGRVNPLDGVEKNLLTEVGGMYMYYAKVVPTTYSSLKGTVIETNQFSVTEHFRQVSKADSQGLPGVFVFYELSPIMVKFVESRQPLTHFLTQLCAILGGIFTVAGMVDRIVYAGWRQIEKKIQTDKLM